MKVLTFGTFDIFHPGHEFYLKNAKSFGDELYVLIALDKTVEKIKGKLPRNNQNKRLKVISELNYVDKAFLGDKEDKFKFLEKVKPDIICFGYDQFTYNKELRDEIKKLNSDIEIIRLDSYYPEKYKSSKL